MNNNNEKVYKTFLGITTKLINIYSGANNNNRKIRYLPEWLDFYTTQLLEENKNNARSYPTYRRGTIVYVNLGSNIGNEFSGNHFCVVLDKKDNPKKSTLTVVPLSSKNSKHYIHLTSSIFDITLNELGKKIREIEEEVDNIRITSKQALKKYQNYFELKIDENTLLLKYKYLTTTYLDQQFKKYKVLMNEKTDYFLNKISKLEKRINNILLVRKVFDRHKNKKSYANVSAITTISKKRIQKINNEDPTGKIQINDNDLKEIEKQILIRFIKDLK
ncbi:type II toxin-antitoxin system PemK/MazF family toxin [Staphylococcus hominis]